MKVLSLFDGMACGMLAMLRQGINVERYVAYEIDKYAVQTAQHNFPIIEEKGDVFSADFTEYIDFDFLVGGSPCTYWSIAQTKNRETVASGIGWELFSQYVRALHEAKPRYFIYENNKSMSAAIRASITETFGFEPICINSALVSAQNRQRLYWVGIKQPDGSYARADLIQPDDRGILLKHILETGAVAWQDKAYAYTTRCQGACAENTLEKHQHTMVAEPVCVAQRGRYDENGVVNQHYEAQPDGKTNTLTTVSKDNLIAEPIKYCTDKNVEHLMRDFGSKGKIVTGDDKTPTLMAAAGMGGGNGIYYAENMIVKEATTKGYTENEPGNCVDLVMPTSKTRRGRNMEDKANCLTTANGFYEYCGTLKSPIYEVKDGLITVKDKQYPIKLVDGFYIIRKLTVKECMRLQTVPEWYEWPVSNSQAYKMLGNGWTVEVIAHLISCINPTEKIQEQPKQYEPLPWEV